MKKRLLTAAVTCALCAGMVIPAMAETSGGAIPSTNGTDVWAGVILDDPDAKIKVAVPTLFAFVVNGVAGGGANTNQPVTSANGSLLLPNVKVVVDTTSGTNGQRDYSITTDQSGSMNFVNYSTAMVGTGATRARAGIAVDLTGTIKNEGTDASRNYWTHVNAAPGTVAGDFKKYRLSIDGQPFSTAIDGGYGIATPITLAAPDVSNGNLNATTNLANVGTTHAATFGIEVGGTRGDYTQVEQSAKVGSIIWTVSYGITNGGVPTAPDNAPLAP